VRVIPVSGPSPAQAGPILVVDDEPYQLLFMEKALQSLGYEVVTAPGAAEALQLLSARKFTLVLTDMFMPGGDGVLLTQEIRRIDRDTSIYLVTALKSIHHLTEALKAGADGYILKPIELEFMRLVLERELAVRALVARVRELEGRA
jgi:DNA-binding NtrC family response regulator